VAAGERQRLYSGSGASIFNFNWHPWKTHLAKTPPVRTLMIQIQDGALWPAE
jgi:hypothetical protein